MGEKNNTPEGIIESSDQTNKTEKPNSSELAQRSMPFLYSVFLLARKSVKKTTAFLREVFKGSGDREGVIKDIQQAFAHLNPTRLGFIGLGVLLILYLLSGVYVVNPGEVAVVKLFGKVVKERVGEGLHYRPPWPIATEEVVNISTIRREGIGLMLQEHQAIHSSPEKIQILTGDENIINIKLIVQYRVKNAVDYLYNVKYRSYLLINAAMRYAITNLGGNMQVDDILTIGKEGLQNRIRIEAQKMLDDYRSGLQLVGINLKEIYPPEEVAEAFRDVSDAKQDSEKSINKAMGYQNSVVPQARGQAQNVLREAEGYKISVSNRANGEANRFEKMLVQYENNKKIYSEDVTRYRLYLESMEKVMSRVKKYVIDSKSDGKINLRLMATE